MNRRTMISSLLGLSLGGRLAQAQTQPYRVSLIGGGFEAGEWRAGILVELDRGWKTYWRMPGEAGIPPKFDWAKSQGLIGADVLYPLPERLHDLSGETIGYQQRVVFPVIAKPVADAAAVKLHLDLFFAVCKDICIPAKAEDTLAFGSANAEDTSTVEDWMKRVPIRGTAVRSVTSVMAGKKAILVVALTQPADDIFVESASPAYFR
ncbi:MAG: hypothetical protein H7X89_15835, partial [Rhizobiales bacterium]|nr:hypothetical protein [Hyphomicrobiales bacterium]